MKKVTFLPKPNKYRKEPKEIIEYLEADMQDIKLRASALNWIVVSVEEVV